MEFIGSALEQGSPASLHCWQWKAMADRLVRTFPVCLRKSIPSRAINVNISAKKEEKELPGWMSETDHRGIPILDSSLICFQMVRRLV